MVFEIRRLCRRVLEILDENREQDDFLRESDDATLRLLDMAESALEGAARVVTRECSTRLLETGHRLEGSFVPLPRQGGARLLLPDDFLRLVSMGGEGWEREPDVVEAGSEAYRIACCGIPGVGGSKEKPVIATLWRPEGMVLEAFPFPGEDWWATYQPEPLRDRDGGLDIPSGVKEAVCWWTAGIVSQELGGKGEGYFEIAKTLMQ